MFGKKYIIHAIKNPNSIYNVVHVYYNKNYRMWSAHKSDATRYDTDKETNDAIKNKIPAKEHYDIIRVDEIVLTHYECTQDSGLYL